MIIFEEQSEDWKQEFYECWKLQELYGSYEIPIHLWDNLFVKAKRNEG